MEAARVSEDLFGRPSTADTGQRNELDLYETPAWMVASLLHHQYIDRKAVVLEPCCGDGSIARALRASGFTELLTNDLDPRHVASWHDDAASLDFWSIPPLAAVDVVISNPPFNDAFRIIEQATLLPRAMVAMLLRKTFLEPTKGRGAWLAEHPPDRLIGLPRHSFRGNGSDSVSCDWCIWYPSGTKPRWTQGPAIVIDDRAKQRRCTR